MISQTFQQALETALQRHLGSHIQLQQAEPLSAGASADTWQLVINDRGQAESLILRRSAGKDNFGATISKSHEAQTQQVAHRHGVPVPVIRFILDEADNLGEGYVMNRLEGETLPKKILGSPQLARARQYLAGQCGETLGKIHQIPLPELPSLKNQSTGEQLDEFFRLYEQYDQIQPVFELAFQWLKANIPQQERTTLVHGDFRNGNLMVDQKGLVAVLDWELAHIGDPMEDLGWICVNSWRFGHRHLPVGGFGTREALFEAYEATTKTTVKAEQVHFWEVFSTLKWGIICLFQCHAHLSGQIPSLERAAIGRRVSETEIDLLDLLRDH